MSVVLRDYQEEAIISVAQAARRKVKSQVLSLPTGAGKTVVFSKVAKQAKDKGLKILILAHRDELLQQAKDKVCAVAPELCAEVGFVKGKLDEWDANVVIASVQTLSRPNRLERLISAGVHFDLIITDECHHAAAASYHRIYEAFHALGEQRREGPLHIGVTATSQRSDSGSLDDVFEEIVYHKDMIWMMERGYLTDLKGIRVKLSDFDPTKLHTKAGDFVERESEEMLRDAKAPYHTVQAWLKHAKTRKTIVFTPTIALAEEMADEYRENGITAQNISGKSMEERAAALDAFRSGKLRVITNAMILTEGFDEPSVECIVIARPTKSKPLYIQMVGRGVRPWLDPETGVEKQNCLVLDMAGATDRLDLVSMPKLFGLGEPDDESELTDSEIENGVEMLGVMGLLAQVDEERRKQGRIVARQIDMFNRKKLSWTMSGPGFWSLGGVPGESIIVKVDPATNLWSTYRIHSVPGYYRSKDEIEVLGERLTLGYAQGVAEDYVKKNGVKKLADKDAAWRKLKPSEGQLAWFAKKGIDMPEGCTRGQASEIMDAAISAKRLRRVAR